MGKILYDRILVFYKTWLSIAGQRIVRLQDSQRGICTKQILFQGFMNAQTHMLIIHQLQQEQFIITTDQGTNCMSASTREPPLWQLSHHDTIEFS